MFVHQQIKVQAWYEIFYECYDFIEGKSKIGMWTIEKLLLNIMPPGSYLNSAFLDNFKTRAALYHAKHPDDSEISEKDAKTM